MAHIVWGACGLWKKGRGVGVRVLSGGGGGGGGDRVLDVVSCSGVWPSVPATPAWRAEDPVRRSNRETATDVPAPSQNTNFRIGAPTKNDPDLWCCASVGVLRFSIMVLGRRRWARPADTRPTIALPVGTVTIRFRGNALKKLRELCVHFWGPGK